MAIEILCQCGRSLAVSDEFAGSKGPCPACGHEVYVPMIDPMTRRPLADQGDLDDPSIPVVTIPKSALQGESPSSSDSAEADVAGAFTSTPGITVEEPGAASKAAPSSEETSSAPPVPAASSALESETGNQPLGEPWREETMIDGYQADAGKIQTVHLLAAALVALTLFAAAPALKHLNLVTAPGWARVVIIMSAVQLLYVGWLVSLPDWSTVWIGMVVFAVVAAVYGMGWAAVTFSPVEREVTFLDLEDVRDQASGWCMAVLLLTTLLTYACGRVSGRWRRAFEVAKAKQQGGATPSA